MTERALDPNHADRVLADFLLRLDRGEAVDRERLLSEHPEAAEDLRRFFEDSDAVEQFAASTFDWPPSERADGPDLAGTRFRDLDLVRELGRGGMGVVYLARQAGLERFVCVKMLISGRHAGDDELRRFLHEAASAAGLRHPHIVAIFDVGQHDGQPFFTMEFVDGQTLADLVRDGPLPAGRAAGYLRAVAEAVEYAHGRGVLHRDLKPSNILIDADDRPRITDFGLARRIEAAASLTQAGAVVGTPGYMPPEQASGAHDRVGPRSDVYALGAVLYELVTGRPPFQGETPLDTLLLLRDADPVRPGLLNPKVPPDLETICLKCLEKDPARRYDSAGSLAAELGRFLEGRPIVARPIGPLRRAARWCRRHPLPAGLMAAALACSAVAAGFAAETYRAYRRASAALVARGRALREAAHERDMARGHLYDAQVQRAWQAWRAGDLDGLDRLLAGLQPRGDEPDRRGWEWSYLRALTHQERRSWDAHAGPVRALAVRPDGLEIASSGDDRIIRLWDLTGGRPGARLDGHTGAVTSVAWAADGTRLASCAEDESVRVWDATHGRLLHSLRLNHGRLRSVAWSPDASRLAVAGESGVDLCDADLSRPPRHLADSPAYAACVAWSPTGQFLASGADDHALRLWEFDGPEIRARTLGRHAGWINAVAWDRDATRLATVGQDGALKVWDVASGRESFARSGESTSALLAVAWTGDGTSLVTSATDGAVTIWDAFSGQRLKSFRGHRGPVHAVCVGPSAPEIASAGDDGSIKLWSRRGSEDGALVRDDPAPVKCVSWSPDGSALASMDLDGTIRAWSPEQGRDLQAWDEPLSRPHVVAWSPAGPLLASTRGEDVLVFPMGARRGPVVLSGHEGPVWCLAWHPAGRLLATAGNDGTIRTWDVERGRAVRVWRAADADVTRLAWGRDGALLASAGTDPVVHIWDASSGTRLRSLSAAEAVVNDLDWSPDGRLLAAAGGDGTVRVFDAETGRSGTPLAGHARAAFAARWSPDGRRIASSGQDGTVRLYDVLTGQEVLVLRGHRGPVWHVAWSRDGASLASAGSDQTVRIWSTRPGPVR
jgi:eukaryotic-like serine/threonine-protein kinase